VVADRIGEIAQVGGDRNFDALGAEGETDRVGGVVGDGEAGDVDIADGETGSGLKQFELRRIFIPRNGRRGEPRNINRNAQLAGDDLKARDVIGMLVGNQNRGQRFRLAVGGAEAFESFLTGQAGID
jgi:hypothetical protein